MKIITKSELQKFEEYLIEEEKSNNTIGKYMRDLKKFSDWCITKQIQEVNKQVALEYKNK